LHSILILLIFIKYSIFPLYSILKSVFLLSQDASLNMLTGREGDQERKWGNGCGILFILNAALPREVNAAVSVRATAATSSVSPPNPVE